MNKKKEVIEIKACRDCPLHVLVSNDEFSGWCCNLNKKIDGEYYAINSYLLNTSIGVPEFCPLTKSNIVLQYNEEPNHNNN